MFAIIGVEMTPEQRRRARRHRDRVKSLVMIVAGTVLITTAITTGVLAATVISQTSTTHAQAKLACKRTRDFGPPLGRFFATHHVFSDRLLREYRMTIPKSCG